MEFVVKVHKLGINPCVDVPERIVNALLRDAKKQSGPVQVKGTLDGAAFETSVVKYSGGWRLYLNTQMRKDAGVDVGDIVHFTLQYDPVPRVRVPPMPETLRVALAKNKYAKERWHLQPRSRRKEILAYLNSLKTKESLERNVCKIIKMLVK